MFSFGHFKKLCFGFCLFILILPSTFVIIWSRFITFFLTSISSIHPICAVSESVFIDFFPLFIRGFICVFRCLIIFYSVPDIENFALLVVRICASLYIFRVFSEIQYNYLETMYDISKACISYQCYNLSKTCVSLLLGRIASRLGLIWPCYWGSTLLRTQLDACMLEGFFSMAHVNSCLVLCNFWSLLLPHHSDNKWKMTKFNISGWEFYHDLQIVFHFWYR